MDTKGICKAQNALAFMLGITGLVCYAIGRDSGLKEKKIDALRCNNNALRYRRMLDRIVMSGETGHVIRKKDHRSGEQVKYRFYAQKIEEITNEEAAT